METKDGSWLDAGLSLKPEYFEQAFADRTRGLWFEIHPENYFMDGGPRLAGLMAVSDVHPISLHGVGASLGGPELPDRVHLHKLAALAERIQPVLISEHAVWSSYAGAYFTELLPLPRTSEAKANLIRGISCYQEALKRQVLIENPASYLPVVAEMDEAGFLVEVARVSGCGLLLDVNNLFVSSRNTGLDPFAYIRAIPPILVGEIHIAGHSADPLFGETLLIDSHDTPVAKEVWSLLEFALRHLGTKPVLLERDARLPVYSDLVREADLARQLVMEIADLDYGCGT